MYTTRRMKEIGVIRHGYNGGGLDGNNSKRLLDRLDRLASKFPSNCGPIFTSLQGLKRVVEGIF